MVEKGVVSATAPYKGGIKGNKSASSSSAAEMKQFYGNTRVNLSVGGHVLVYGSLPRYPPSYVGGANKHTHQKYQTIDDTILELYYNVFYSSTKSARGGPRM